MLHSCPQVPRAALLPILLSALLLTPVSCSSVPSSRCRTLPGDPAFPSPALWNQLNSSVDGRLLSVVPSAKFCEERSPMCSEDEWESTVFRSTIPGAMDNVNWEQDYTSNPPSLCLHNGTTCGQGNVPVYAINVTEASHIQAGIAFASAHNLKVAIKSSGHDFLGRSTARGSLLIWTHYLRNITFIDSFTQSNVEGMGSTDFGPAVKVGSGVPLNALYEETKKQGRFYVGGITASVALAGGYVQGAGHSAFSPVLGLGADNALEFEVVLANGSFVTVNENNNSELFWALRGGGPGSWGVVVSATVRTYQAFPAAVHSAGIIAPTNATTGDLLALHARHVFDWDNLRAGQYFYLFSGAAAGNASTGNLLQLSTYFANTSAEAAFEAMRPLLDDARNSGFIVQGGSSVNDSVQVALANDLMFVDDVALGSDNLLTSRLIPAEMYRKKGGPETIGKSYSELMIQGIPIVLGHLVAGGKVADNANISSAVHPKWRTAKTHVIAGVEYSDALTPSQVIALKHDLTRKTTPVLVAMTGESDSGAYSNESDVLEPDFQTTFFGKKNYQRLLMVKRTYDPTDLFIVGAGVGSERWDADGLCLRN